MATRSPETSHRQVQRLTPPNLSTPFPLANRKSYLINKCAIYCDSNTCPNVKLNHSQAKTKPDEWTEVVKPFPLSLSTIWWNHFHCLCLRSGGTTSTVCLLCSSTIATGTYSNWRGILQYFKKCIQHPINIYATHPPSHCARTWKVSRKYSNTSLSYSAETKCDGQTNGRTEVVKPLPLSLSTIWWNHFHYVCLLYSETTAKRKQNVTDGQRWWNHSHCLHLLSGETTSTVSVYYLVNHFQCFCLIYSETTAMGTYSKWRGIFQYFKFHKHPINVKNYTAHRHDMVHVPAKFTVMPRRVTVRKRNVTDGQTDGWTDWRTGRFNISRPGPSTWREITNISHLLRIP